MSVPIFLVICFIGFAVFYPSVYPFVTGKEWSKDQIKGYRIGMLGAAVVTISFIIMNHFFPIQWLH